MEIGPLTKKLSILYVATTGILFWITHTMIFTPVSMSRAALTFDIKYDVSYTFPKQNEFCAPLSLGGRVAGQHGDIWRPRHTRRRRKNMKEKRKNKSSFCLLLHFSWKHQPHHFEVFIVSLLWKGRICHFYCEQNAAATV